MPPVYRAPMRSRRDDVDHAAAVERALVTGVVGVGGRLSRVPVDLDDAVRLTDQEHGERTARRLERFAAVGEGATVWTRSADGLHVGQVVGPWRYDASPEAHALDLVNVRDCAWEPDPVPPGRVPAAVTATFARGGRNFQEIRALREP